MQHPHSRSIVHILDSLGSVLTLVRFHTWAVIDRGCCFYYVSKIIRIVSDRRIEECRWTESVLISLFLRTFFDVDIVRRSNWKSSVWFFFEIFIFYPPTCAKILIDSTPVLVLLLSNLVFYITQTCTSCVLFVYLPIYIFIDMVSVYVSINNVHVYTTYLRRKFMYFWISLLKSLNFIWVAILWVNFV